MAEITRDKNTATPKNLSASSLSFIPNFKDTEAAEPIPINNENANIKITTGNTRPTPVIPRYPVPFIFPIYILSTTLYKAFTNIPTIAGIENFISNFVMLSVSIKLCLFSISILFYTFLHDAK